MGTELTALERLEIKLGIEDASEQLEAILNEYLNDAEQEIKLFLNIPEDEELETRFVSSQIQLASIYYKKDTGKNVKSESYSEGVVSESTTYLIGADYDGMCNDVLQKLARYRRVYVRSKNQS